MSLMERKINIPRLTNKSMIVCVLAVGGCATNGAADASAYSLPPLREDTIARLAVDGQNAYINGARAPHGSYVRDGDLVTTGPGTSANLIFNSGASNQLDQNTDPWFTLILKGACVTMELVRGQAAVATNKTCVELKNVRLDFAGEAHSIINIRAEEREARVTVIEGEMQMSRPGAATIGANQEYIVTPGGQWQVRQLAPADAAATTAWTRNYFRPTARQPRSSYLIPLLIGAGTVILSGAGGDDHPAGPSPQTGTRPTSDRAGPQTTPTVPPGADRTPAQSAQTPATPYVPGAAGAARARSAQSGVRCLPAGGSISASSLVCMARKGEFHPAGTDPNVCPGALR